jgi:hypothetical protein
VVFQDSKYSYLPEESNQIDYQSYCSPLAAIHICNELFAHILKSREEFAQKEIKWLGRTQGEVDTKPCSIELPSFCIDSNWFRNGRFLLTKYFSGVKAVQLSGKVFSLSVEAQSVFEAVNLLSIISLFTHVTNDYGLYTYIDDSLAQKYGRVLTNIRRVPYFVFYLFIMRAVKSERQFNELKPVFEKYLAVEGLTVDLQWQGNTYQRIQYIAKQLETDIPILDIGCGELLYYKKMMKIGFKSMYYAVDKDERMEALSNNIARRYEENNLKFFGSLDDFSSDSRLNILITEVIEHNDMEVARELIGKALGYNVNKLIITTPNADFNQFYNMDSPMRHEDHVFELSSAEFKAMIEACIDNGAWQTEYFEIGDCINGIRPTQGCIIYSHK